ncbi:YraN family protein [bacterium]|nr:YraN family protein [bacterium]
MNLKANTDKGKQGELIAQEYIKKCGMKIIECNWHYSKNAEIDIIAEEKDTLVFIEVKTRLSLNFGHPFEAITQEKINKINTAILAYLKQCDKTYKNYRFDGIAIIGLQNPKIEYLKDIGQF